MLIVISISFVLAEYISGATPMLVFQAWKVLGQSQEQLNILVPAALCLAENWFGLNGLKIQTQS